MAIIVPIGIAIHPNLIDNQVCTLIKTTSVPTSCILSNVIPDIQYIKLAVSTTFNKLRTHNLTCLSYGCIMVLFQVSPTMKKTIYFNRSSWP